jgi:hypothetical protein
MVDAKECESEGRITMMCESKRQKKVDRDQAKECGLRMILEGGIRCGTNDIRPPTLHNKRYQLVFRCMHALGTWFSHRMSNTACSLERR